MDEKSETGGLGSSKGQGRAVGQNARLGFRRARDCIPVQLEGGGMAIVLDDRGGRYGCDGVL